MKKITIILGIITSIFLIVNNKEEYILIPNEAIRVRVVANSNSEHDIKVKEELKDFLNIKINNLINNVTNIEKARKIITNNLDIIHNYVDKKLKEMNYLEPFNINYGLNIFPEKEFKGIKYNSGLYESLVITLGDGNGPNYWCVLYPPLCSIDINKEEVEYRSFIKDLIDKYL